MMPAAMPLFGAIEAGGTKFVCAVGRDPTDMSEVVRFETTTPQETLRRCIEFFRQQPKLDGLGVGCFGPIDLKRGSQSYGLITTTPKPGWANTDIVGTLERELELPVVFDTDVNGAALGEARWGAARGLDSVVYVTVGTGIGGGAVMGGKLAHGLVHPEMGHLLLPREPDDLDFEGFCPFHGARCWEGLAAGPAIEKRFRQRAETLGPEHPAWDLEARYIGSALATLVLVLSPERLILGGGVMQQAALFAPVRRYLARALGGYVKAAALDVGLDEYVVPPLLGSRAGIAGALALAGAGAPARQDM